MIARYMQVHVERGYRNRCSGEGGPLVSEASASCAQSETFEDPAARPPWRITLRGTSLPRGPMSVLTKISEHVYWMPPGPPDRPSVCGVVGDRRTLMLDAGSSRAHTRAFLDALWAETAARPSTVVYTHSHWDHVFGGAELGGQVIAHALTAQALMELAAMDWTDEGLDQRVAAGHASPQHAANVKEELPSPRTVEVAPADIVFQDGLDIELGGVTVRVRHVGGNHCI